jgi:glycosyltransferase involved in cell wall biosynthesis
MTDAPSPSGSGEDRPPAISVVTVVRNGADVLARCLESVAGQTCPGVEHVVVDGASTDGTADVLRAWNERLSHWISEPDSGIYDAMNKGIALARGEWIHILNADDRYASPSALEEALPRLDPGRTNAFPVWLDYPEGDARLHRPVGGWRRQLLSPAMLHPGLIVHRSQYEAVGCFDTTLSLAADHDFILRLARRFPPLHHATPLVRMSLSGASTRRLWQGAAEYARVAARHGLPAPLAWTLAVGKYAWWRFPRGPRRILRRWLRGSA